MWTKSHLTLLALTWPKSCLTFLFNSSWFRHKHNETRTRQLLLSFHFSLYKYSHVGYVENTSYHLIHTINLFLLLYLNLQDDNGVFRNSLNCISASLTETALLQALLHCKDTYYMHRCCCLLHFTKTNKLWILLKTRPSKEVKTSSNWRPVIQQLSISYAPVRSEHRPPIYHLPHSQQPELMTDQFIQENRANMLI